jgi:hypothetical protein
VANGHGCRFGKQAVLPLAQLFIWREITPAKKVRAGLKTSCHKTQGSTNSRHKLRGHGHPPAPHPQH